MKVQGLALVIGLAVCGVGLGQDDRATGRDQNPGAQNDRAQDRGSAIDRPTSNPQGSEVSPVRGIDRQRASRRRGDDIGVQSLDGANNNLDAPQMGAIHTQLVRAVAPAYADGVSELAGSERPSARAISNIVHAQTRSIPNSRGYSDLLWQWGQFLDHDIDLTDGADPQEPAPIAVPLGDELFDPAGTGVEVIEFNRSIYAEDSGGGLDNPRQQINEITAWIDGSNIYGSDEERAAALRTHVGGRLKTSAGDLLPFNLDGLANAGGAGANLFLAGDVRANEQVGLTVIHTLFMREHNRIAQRLAEADSQLSDQALYQRARREVTALLQIITYQEFLPALLGPGAIAPYQGYDPSVNAGIRNVFSAAAYRLGHTMLSPTLLRLDADGNESEFGHLSLADAFFRPDRLAEEGGIDPILRGLAAQVCQSVDVFVVDEVRNFLFGLPGSGGFDLASLNIQRGRDHGLGSYNEARQAYGLPPVARFNQVTQDRRIAQRLAAAYGSPNDMDIWSAGLAEDAVAGGLLGPLFQAVVADQFTALRDGDRFWYQRVFRGQRLRELQQTTLADIIRRNTTIGDEIADNVFVVTE